MATLAIILYKPQNPLDPDSSPQTDTEHTINVGTAGNKITTDNKYDIYVTVKNVSFNKKVYSPCELTFQLHVTQINDEKGVKQDLTFSQCAKIADTLSGYGVKLKCTTSMDTYPCLNYYIYDINPQFATESGAPSIRLYITAYSVDHRLTLHKTNRAFTAKKFLTEVVEKDLGTGGALVKFGVPVNVKTRYLQFIKSYRKKVSQKANGSDSKTSYADHHEILQPYLVQYDESYYNFVARTANRCGEFMYFEDGQLCLGLDQPFYEEPTAINYDDTEPAEGRSKARSSTITGISLRRRNQPDQPELKPYYPKTMKQDGAKLEYASGDFVEDAKVGNDEFLISMEKGNWVDFEKDLYFPEGKLAVLPQMFAKALNNQSILDMIGKIGLDFTLKAATAAATQKSINKSNDKSYWDKLTKKSNGSDFSEKAISDGKSYMFSSDTSQWDPALSTSVFKGYSDFTNELSLGFYHTLLNFERQVAQEAITVETGADYDEEIKLGKVVKLNGKLYVVTGVNGNYDNTGAHPAEKYSFTLVPVKERTDISFTVYYDLTKGDTPEKQETETKKKVVIVIPPLYEHGHICHSSMQRAIVTNAGDPQSLGRVRIKYPWQSGSGDDSPFIRVAKDFAGDGFGINFKTEEKTEVLVDYEDGNVERPFVVGMLHSFAKKPQRPNRSIRSAYGHKIVFNDPVDTHKMFENIAGQACSLLVTAFASDTYDSNLKKLAGGIEISDALGFYKLDMSTERREINIASPFGKIDINAFTGITINAPNGDIKICGKNVEIEATNNLNICAGSQIDKKLFKDGGLMNQLSNAVSSAVGSIMNQMLPDIKLIRCIVEAFVKPCNGNLRIKSYRYLMLEAGANGRAQIPQNAYKRGKAPEAKKDNDESINFPNGYDFAALNAILVTRQTFREKAQILITTYNDVVEARRGLTAALNSHENGLNGPMDQRPQKKQDIQTAFINGEADINAHLVAEDNADKQAISQAYNHALNIKTQLTQLIGNLGADNNQINDLAQQPNPTINGNTLWNLMKQLFIYINDQDFYFKAINVDGEIEKYFNNNLKFPLIQQYVTKINNELHINLTGNNESPEKFIASLSFPKDGALLSVFKSIADGVLGGLQKYSPVEWWKDFKYDTPYSRAWEASSHINGQILFSDSNTHGGVTIPLKNLSDQRRVTSNDISTLNLLKAKLYNFIQD